MHEKEYYEKFCERIPGEDDNEYLYRMLMGLKMDMLEYLRENPEKEDSCAIVNDALKQVNEAEKSYQVIAYAKLYGTEDSDDEPEEEHINHEDAGETHLTTGDTAEAEETKALSTTEGETQENLSEMQLAEIGAAKLWEYAQWIHSNEVEPEADQFVIPYSEPDADTEPLEIDPNFTEETFPPEDSGIKPTEETLAKKNQEDSTLYNTDRLPPDPGKLDKGTKVPTDKNEEFFKDSTNCDELHEAESDREPLLEGRVFDVGKTTDNDSGQPSCKTPEVKIVLENPDDTVTTKSGGKETPTRDTTFPYEPGGSPEVRSINLQNKPTFYENTPHEVKEKINSPCSQVWKVKSGIQWDPEAEMRKTQKKPRPSNKQLKPGWDPPDANSVGSDGS